MKFFKLARQEAGKAMIELAFVTPLLVGIGIASIDAVNYNRLGHIMSAVVREAGRASFVCTYLTSSANDIRNCIRTNIEQSIPNAIGTNTGTGAVALNADITITVWEYRDPGISGPVLISQFRRGTLDSRVPAARVATLHSYTPQKNRIMIVETRMPFGPITPYMATERYLVMVM